MAMIRFPAKLALLLLPVIALPQPAPAQEEEPVKGAPAEPLDAPETREWIAAVERMLPSIHDRGAALYVLAAWKQHLGETREALKLLKECVELREGFEPSSDPLFRGLKGTKDFDTIVERAQREFPPVANAKTVLITEEKDLVPEGLAWDAKRKVFYLGSLYRRKIVEITPESRTADFVPRDRDSLLPILGIRPAPGDGSVWAITTDFSPGHEHSEVVHFDPEGQVLERYAPPGPGRHGLNDLVVRAGGEVLATDSVANELFRLDRASHTFLPVKLYRPIFYPNGIALADDDKTLFVADALGVVLVDLATGTSREVESGAHSTLAGADGLYWHNGNLVAVQNGIGSPRVALFRLSRDGSRVTGTTVLESRTTHTDLPTTGAVRGNDFYFIENSQLDNLNNNRVMDVTRLEKVRIAMVHLP